MSNWDDHHVVIVGPADEIERFADEFKIVDGKLDENRKVIPAYGGAPSIAIDARRYYASYCRVGIADIEFIIEAVGYDPEQFYRELCDKYPTLNFIWRYWLDMGWGCGYIDKDGDHRWHEDFAEPHDTEFQIHKGIGLYNFANLIGDLVEPELQRRALHQSPDQLFSAYMTADGCVYLDPNKPESESLVTLARFQGWEPNENGEDVSEQIIEDRRLVLSLEDVRETYNQCMAILGGKQITAEEIIECKATNREKLGYPEKEFLKALEEL